VILRVQKFATWYAMQNLQSGPNLRIIYKLYIFVIILVRNFHHSNAYYLFAHLMP